MEFINEPVAVAPPKRLQALPHHLPRQPRGGGKLHPTAKGGEGGVNDDRVIACAILDFTSGNLLGRRAKFVQGFARNLPRLDQQRIGRLRCDQAALAETSEDDVGNVIGQRFRLLLRQQQWRRYCYLSSLSSQVAHPTASRRSALFSSYQAKADHQ